MDVIYEQILNFKIRSAKKMYNSSYLEDLTGLMAKATSRIDSGENYYFDSNYYLDNISTEQNSNYEDFIKLFKNSFEYSTSNKVTIIRGKAGVGKTLFFNKGIQLLIRDKTQHEENYIKLGVDFENIDAKKDVSFYTEFIYKKLRSNAIFAIRQLGDDIFKEFNAKYNDFCGTIEDTEQAKMYPIMYFCKYIYKTYKKPCIIILDNIDLACVNTQRNVFRATSIVCKEFYEFMSAFNAKNIYRIYFAIRPETTLRKNEMDIGEVINFPLPNIQAICLETIKTSLLDTAKEFDQNERLKCEVTYYSIITGEKITAKTFSDVAVYFNKIFDHYLNNLWSDTEHITRLGTNQEFHCNISNYNVRTFLEFLIDTLSNGGFKPLTKEFNNRDYALFYSVFDYIEMIIRGRWTTHPGNKHIDGEGGNKAPIIFNMFESSLWTNTQESKIRHFMLYIRVLQYFNMCSDDAKVTYGQLLEQLSHFFDKKHLENAVKELVFVRILYSSNEGEENIASKQSWTEVEINENTLLYLSTTGKFYLEKLICEFEYLYQMSLSSIMPSCYVKELLNCWHNEKELTVLRFIQGMFGILKINLESYDDANVLHLFKEIFCQDDELNCKLYRRILNSFIMVMKRKIQKAKAIDANSFEKLNNILEEAEILQKDAQDFFIKMLGEEI